MKITKSQLRQMIREALSATEADVQKMVDGYIEAHGKSVGKRENEEQKKTSIIKTLESMYPQMDFYHRNKAAIKIYNMGKSQ
jgi:hypothetical protein